MGEKNQANEKKSVEQGKKLFEQHQTAEKAANAAQSRYSGFLNDQGRSTSTHPNTKAKK
jgi:hypothetical protein